MTPNATPTETHPLAELNAVLRAISRVGERPGRGHEAARAELAAAIARLLPEDARVAILPARQAPPNAVAYPLTDDFVLSVELAAGDALAPEQQAMLENAAIHASAILARVQDAARMQQSLQRKEEELARLRRADMLISSRLDLQETLESILQMALEVTGARYGIFRLVDETRQRLVTRAFAGEDLGHPATEALPLDETSITGMAAVQRKTLCIADVQAPPWSRLYYPLDYASPMRSELVAPLIAAGGRLEGVLNLESPNVAAFSDDDALLLQSFAIQAVIAIQEARLLDALQDLSARLLTDPPEVIYGRVVHLARELLGSPAAGLWTCDDGRYRLQIRQPEQTPIPDALTAALARAAAPERIPLPQGEALIAPMIDGESARTTGALVAWGDSNARFVPSDWDKKVLALLARHAALAADNARRQAALRRAREQQAAAETFAAMGDIAANLLHRLNNKLGLIPVRIEGVEDKSAAALAADPYLARNLEAIRASAVEALDIVRESLTHLRPITLTAASIPEAVNHALAETAIPAGVTIRRQGLDGLPPVIAGRRRLALVFHNLIENAIAAMPDGGEIVIAGEQTPEWVQVIVRDTGPGIPPDLHEVIFQFNYSGRRAAGKLGFGLWWVKTIMARFGGSVQVASDGVSGATFILRFPMAEKGSLADRETGRPGVRKHTPQSNL